MHPDVHEEICTDRAGLLICNISHPVILVTPGSWIELSVKKSLQDVLPIIAQCLEGVQRCTDSMDEKEVENYHQILSLQRHCFCFVYLHRFIITAFELVSAGQEF